MAKKTSVKSSKAKTDTTSKGAEKKIDKSVDPQGDDGFFNLTFKTWIESAKIFFENKTGTGSNKAIASANFAKVIFVNGSSFESATKILNRELSLKQLDFVKKSKLEFLEFHGNKGPLWIVRPLVAKTATAQHRGLIKPDEATRVRDFYGQILRQVLTFSLTKLELIFVEATAEEIRQALIGLELSSYRFTQEFFSREKKLPKLEIYDLRMRKLDRKQGHQLLQKSVNPESLRQIACEAKAINLARHLVNLPPNILNPESYAAEIEKTFKVLPNVSVEVWQGDRLKKENMNLLRAVGQGSEHGPRLVHLRYRPKALNRPQPIAFVGKGITFDTGGLDLKPSSGMRLMKKDMGGSAAVAALCYWASTSGYPNPLDFYLSIAENSVDEKAFRPSDVIVARSGASVEIHNTDAEGRLILADALDVAVKQPPGSEPMAVINIATLTGAIKVGLGTEVAGLFCNNDVLTEMLFEAGRQQNDLCWPMPLFQNYRNQLRSQFADMSNCSDGGFGGAISAALFLETFVGQKAWAHLDIYAWKEGPQGAYSESGGSGQSVLMLSQFLNQVAASYARGEKIFAETGT